MGRVMTVGADIQLCLPPVVCSPNETCLPGLGSCVAGQCVYKTGYQGLATLPQAWATQYCDLNMGTCNGIWHSPDNTPLAVAQAVGTKMGRPLCTTAPAGTTCVGITAPPPLVVGNSQRTIDPSTGRTVALWGLGTTWASGLCYEITGPGGTAVVAVTDRCGGYCNCKQISNGQVIPYQECGGCIDATTHTDVNPQCTCVGNAPPVYTQCCGRGCPTMSTNGFCDWCAANNHPHFDLDDATFAHVCGPDGPMYGSCQLSKAHFLPCYDALAVWPPR
jgi:hypothetical protein